VFLPCQAIAAISGQAVRVASRRGESQARPLPETAMTKAGAWKGRGHQKNTFDSHLIDAIFMLSGNRTFGLPG
jgi:hypothetical protein